MEFSLQALLVRHEAYMADAEKERIDMMAQIEELESQKHGLQKTNESLVTENRTLLDQLEAINTALAELRDDGTYDELYAQYFPTEG